MHRRTSGCRQDQTEKRSMNIIHNYNGWFSWWVFSPSARYCIHAWYDVLMFCSTIIIYHSWKVIPNEIENVSALADSISAYFRRYRISLFHTSPANVHTTHVTSWVSQNERIFPYYSDAIATSNVKCNSTHSFLGITCSRRNPRSEEEILIMQMPPIINENTHCRQGLCINSWTTTRMQNACMLFICSSKTRFHLAGMVNL